MGKFIHVIKKNYDGVNKSRQRSVMSAWLNLFWSGIRRKFFGN